MPKLEDLQLKIKQTGDTKASDIQKIANALSKLSEHGARLKLAARSLGDFNDEVRKVKADKANALGNAASGLAKLTKAVSDASNAPAVIRSIGAAINDLANGVNTGKLSSIASAMTEIRSASRGFRNLSARADTTAAKGVGTQKQNAELVAAEEETTSRLDRVKAAIKEFGSSAASALSKVGPALKKVGSSALSTGKQLLSMGWQKLKSQVTGLTNSLGNLWHSFTRIAMYRALRTAIKAITQGFSEGIKHLYEWSRIVGNSFKDSMDSIATSAHYLRDSLGAMASPLIDALAPAIEFVVDKFVSLLNIVNQFIATFTGQSTWRRAVRTPTEYASGMEEAAKSTKKATEAQKKLNKSLMDFDELHLITTSTTGGSNPSAPSGGGGSGGGIDSTHFVEEPIADWIQAIKDAIDNGDWYGAGALLADKLNSIIENWDARAWGEKLGEKVENGLKFYLGFMKNFKWDTLGLKAADFINGLLSKIDPKDLGDAITAKLEAGLKFLANFVPNIKLTGLGTALGVAFNNVFSEETMNNLADTIAGAVNDVTDFAKGFISEADFKTGARNIMSGLFRAITTIDWQTMGETLADFGTGLLDALFEALGYAITHLDEIVGAVVLFVNGFFGKLGDYFHEKLFGWADDVNNWFAEVFGTDGAIGSAVPNSLVGDLDVPKLNIPVDDSDIKTANSNAITLEKTLATLAKKKYKTSVTVTNLSTNTSNADKLRTALSKIDGKTFAATVKVTTKGVTTATNASGKYVSLAYAQGGYPDVGSIFVAGEAGPEFVSKINGKTGVASAGEVTGIREAVYNSAEQEAALLKEQNRLLRMLLGKDMSVTLAPTAAAGKWVAQSQAAYAKASG